MSVDEEFSDIDLSDMMAEVEYCRIAMLNFVNEASRIVSSVNESTTPKSVKVPVMQPRDGRPDRVNVQVKQFLPTDRLTGEVIDDFKRKQIYKMKKANPNLGLITGEEIKTEAEVIGKRKPRPQTIDYAKS